jgi:phage repressor protein C with HTH and peptisase S24 domain
MGDTMTKFTHATIWRAIDRTAEVHGLSASALARAADLDPTSFNKSKRLSPTGKPRWPTVETIAKVLNGVGDSVEDFVERLSDHRRGSAVRIHKASRRSTRTRRRD